MHFLPDIYMHSPMQILACAAASTWFLYRLRTFLFHRLYGNCLLLHFLPGLRLALFQLVYMPADAEHDADVRTVDKGRSTALADKRKRLARDRHDAYSHQHVEHGLRHQEEADAHDEEGIIGLVTIAGDAPDAHQEPNVKESDNSASYQPQFFDDDGIDEIGESLRKEIPLHAVSGSLSQYAAGSNGYVGMGNLASPSISNFSGGTIDVSK